MINIGDNDIEKLRARIEQLDRQLAHYRATDDLGPGARYRALFDSMPQLVWATNQDGWHTYYNRRWYEFTGLSEEESLGFGFATALHPDDREHTLQRWRRAWHDGESYEIEYRFRRYDGIYEWFIGRAMPVFDEEGRIVEWIGTCTNIHEQKRVSEEMSNFIAERQQAENRLRSSESRHRALADAMPLLVWLATPDGTDFHYNQRYLQYTGLSSSDLTAEGWSTLIHPDDRDEALARWQASLANGFLYEREFRLRRHDGEYRWMLVRAVAVRDEHHAIAYWVGTNTIIEDQKRTEEMLRERSAELAHMAHALEVRNRELDQFAYVTSHDLKAPLRGIANLAGWIEEDLPDISPTIKQHLDLMRGRVYRMEALIEGILQFSRIGRVKQEPERVDVAELIDDVIDLLAVPPHITCTISVDLPPLFTQKLLLQQVFANLIGNAAKHGMRDDLQIEIRAQQHPEYIEFRVADNGQGIAPKYHERVFGIFQTLASRDKVEGSGLGLALVKRIIEQQHGKIWIESEEGAGATFIFTWPCHTQPR
jgi:PAS domain S-box-containing protein